MPDEADKRSGAEEFVTAEIELTTPLAPEEERNLRSALGKIDPRAFDSCDVGPQKISLSYDPTRTSKDDLVRLIREAGGNLKNVASEKSPLIPSGEAKG
jgi:hypothetical protein